MAMAENDGDQAESYRYKEFGEQTVVDSSFAKLSTYSSNIGNWKRYTGQEHALPSSFGDPWYFYRARVYRADAGRFVQRDPLQHSDGANRYSYVLNSPTNRLDPSGTISVPGPIVFGFPSIGRGQYETKPTAGLFPVPVDSGVPVPFAPAAGFGGNGGIVTPAEGWLFQCPKFNCVAETCECTHHNSVAKVTTWGPTQCRIIESCSSWEEGKCTNTEPIPDFYNCNCMKSDNCVYLLVCTNPSFVGEIACNMCPTVGLGWISDPIPDDCHPK